MSDSTFGSLPLLNDDEKNALNKYLIDKAEGEPMLQNFNDLHKGKLEEVFSIEPAIIADIAKAITNYGFDGIRIMNGAKMVKGVWVNLIYMVGTYAGADLTKHTEAWNDLIQSTTGKQFFPPKNEADQFYADFDSQFRTSSNGLLSQKVWLDALVFAYLAAERAANSKVEKIHISQAAYLNLRPGNGQVEVNQSTFILTQVIGGVDDWSALAFNHGQLCPQFCD